MNKSQAETKVYAFDAVFRVDVNDVKPFQNLTETSPFDHFLDPQSICFSSFLRGSGSLRAYQNDYVIDNYVEPGWINIICTKNLHHIVCLQ